MLSCEDRLAIHDLISLYGHIIDNRQFTRTHELFTDDAIYDTTDFGAGIHVGWQAIAQMWRDSEDRHPLAHHATNVMVSEDVDGTVRVVSKGIGIRPNGWAGTTIYKDIVVKTSNGWRMSERVALRRVPETIPAHS